MIHNSGLLYDLVGLSERVKIMTKSSIKIFFLALLIYILPIYSLAQTEYSKSNKSSLTNSEKISYEIVKKSPTINKTSIDTSLINEYFELIKNNKFDSLYSLNWNFIKRMITRDEWVKTFEFQYRFYGKLLNFKPSFFEVNQDKWALVIYDLEYENVNAHLNATFEVLTNTVKVYNFDLSVDSNSYVIAIDSIFNPFKKALIRKDKEDLYSLSSVSFKNRYPNAKTDSLFSEIFKYNMIGLKINHHYLGVFRGLEYIKIVYNLPLDKGIINVVLSKLENAWELENLQYESNK